MDRLKTNVIGDKIDPKAVLNLDSGLGVVDAFVASFSMILVSEVCAFYSPYLFLFSIHMFLTFDGLLL